MRRVTLFIFLIGFVLLRPHEIGQSGLLYPTDDYGYFAHASSIAFGQFPSFAKEECFHADYPVAHPGPGWMASPFVFLFSFLDRMMGAEIVQIRTPENIPLSFSLYGFVLATSFYFWFGCYLLFRGLRHHFAPAISGWTIVLMVLCQGLPIYVFVRPLSSHAYEFFLQSLMVFFLLARNGPGQTRVSRREWALIALGLTLMVTVRFNNVPAALIWPFLLMPAGTKAETRALRRKIFMAAAGLVLIAAGVIFLIYLKDSAYIMRKIGVFLRVENIFFYPKRVMHILLGIDWGLAYTAPYVLVGLAGAFLLKFPLRKKLLIALLPMAVNFLAIMLWKTQGGYYGYRYFTTSIIPLLVYPLALIMKKLKEGGHDYWRRGFFLLALLPALSMLCFDGNTSNLSFRGVQQYFGIAGPGNDTFQMEVWEMLLFSPLQLLWVMCRGGVFYCMHLVGAALGLSGKFPSPILMAYPAFQTDVFVKTLGIYLLPFVLLILAQRLERLRDNHRHENNEK